MYSARQVSRFSLRCDIDHAGVENHHPLPIFTEQILGESLDVSPPFLRYYKARVIARVGRNTKEVLELDWRGRKGAEDWVPSFK